MTSAERIKRDINEGWKNREARVATLVADSIRNALDMLDEQPAAVLEAMIDRAKLLQRPGRGPKHRYKVRAALIDYLEERLQEAQARERRLAQAITGVENPNE